MVEVNSEAVQKPRDPKIPDLELKTFRRAKALGWLQLIGGIVLVGMTLSSFFTEEAYVGSGALSLKVILYIVPLILLYVAAAFVPIIAGYGLLKGTRYGFRLSVLNQLLQLIGFTTASVYWNYACLGGVYIMMYSLPAGGFGYGVFARLEPGFQFGFGPGFGSDEVTISVDILAVFFLSVLYSLARLTKHN